MANVAVVFCGRWRCAGGAGARGDAAARLPPSTLAFGRVQGNHVALQLVRSAVTEHRGRFCMTWDSLSVLQHSFLPQTPFQTQRTFFLSTSRALESQLITVINLIIDVLGSVRIRGF